MMNFISFANKYDSNNMSTMSSDSKEIDYDQYYLEFESIFKVPKLKKAFKEFLEVNILN
jgi:hypothetical protein